MKRIHLMALILLTSASVPVLAKPAQTGAQRGFITGTVTNAQGQPLARVEVVADNTLGYNSNLITHTDAQGHYALKVTGMPVTFRVSAKTTLEYHGSRIPITLTPKGESVVPGNVGGVVNFVLKPDTSTPYGNLGVVTVQRGVGSDGEIDFSHVVLTLTPVGTLADGSRGKALVVRPVHLAGWFVVNVMYGTYTVTATENGRPLQVRQKGDGSVLREWGSSFTGDFLKDLWSPNPALNVEVRHPERATAPAARADSVSGAPGDAAPQRGGAAGGPTITGTLTADADLSGAVVFACVPAGSGGAGCDQGFTRATTITTSGRRAPYTMTGLSLGLEYRMVAWLDRDGDGDVNAGDLLGVFGGDGTTVMAPGQNINITLQPAR